MTDDVRKRLPAEIAVQLTEAEREELVRRLAVQDRLATRLRTLPLADLEPSPAAALERER
jgi:hypothetical protein